MAIVALPIATVLLLAINPSDNIWPHLVSTVLPGSLWRTILLSAGVAAVTFSVGTAAAWLVTMYRFPGREVLDRLLVLPLAVPTYIIAYCYVELFDYAGPVQTHVRHAFGFTGAADYWFPQVRSLGGAVFVLSAVLYPYVYLTARASFAQQSVCVLEVARTLGRSPLATFADVALPLARPAIAAGVALVIMECLNDLGAVQYLGVDTLSASIYATWMQRSNLGGAAQLAAVMLVLIAALFAIERAARGGARSHHTTGRYRAIPFQEIGGWKGALAAGLAALPFLFGFVVPVLVIAQDAATHTEGALASGFLAAAGNSLLLAAIAAGVAVAVALTLGYARRVGPKSLHSIGGARRGARLCGARHRIGHRPADPARRHRQSCRRLHARNVRRFDRVAPFGLAVRHHAGLRDPLSRRRAGAHRGRHGPRLAQPRRCRADARRERAVGPVARAPAAAGGAAGRRGAAGVRRQHEGAAGDFAAAALQFRDAGDARLLARLDRAAGTGIARGPDHRPRRARFPCCCCTKPLPAGVRARASGSHR